MENTSDLLFRAAEIADKETATLRELQDALSWALIAVETDQSSVAHSILATLALRLDDDGLAEKHAAIAKSYEPNDFYVQNVKTNLALKRVKFLGMWDVMSKAGNAQSDWEANLSFLVGIAGNRKAVASQENLIREVEELLRIFKENAQISTYSCKDYIEQASTLSEYAHILDSDEHAHGTFKELITRIYGTISNISPSEFPCSDPDTLSKANQIYVTAKGQFKRRTMIQPKNTGCLFAFLHF